LKQHSAGLSEYELIRELRKKLPYLQNTDNTPWQLFHTHFLVFHGLYRLQAELADEKTGHLKISPLQIIMTDYTEPGTQAVAENDQLRDFYLDLNHLTEISEDDIYTMLAGFWNEM
jgi:hypothetical protein